VVAISQPECSLTSSAKGPRRRRPRPKWRLAVRQSKLSACSSRMTQARDRRQTVRYRAHLGRDHPWEGNEAPDFLQKTRLPEWLIWSNSL
jgi:hypothetical protein